MYSSYYTNAILQENQEELEANFPWRNKGYFTNYPLNGDNKYTLNDDNKYTASEICKVIEFLVDNIYVRFGGQLF